MFAGRVQVHILSLFSASKVQAVWHLALEFLLEHQCTEPEDPALPLRHVVLYEEAWLLIENRLLALLQDAGVEPVGILSSLVFLLLPPLAFGAAVVAARVSATVCIFLVLVATKGYYWTLVMIRSDFRV